jgi:hypothetical protein
MELNRILNPVTPSDTNSSTHRVKSSTVKKSLVSGVFNLTSATKAFTAASSACTQSPTHGASPAHVTWRPAYTPPVSYYAQATRNPASHGSRSLPEGPVLPVITESHRYYDPTSNPLFWPRLTSHPGHTLKRKALQTPLPEGSASKKKTRWTLEEDSILIERRSRGVKWDGIAKCLPGRSSLSCRLRYHNYIDRAIWDEEKKNKLARVYARYVQKS